MSLAVVARVIDIVAHPSPDVKRVEITKIGVGCKNCPPQSTGTQSLRLRDVPGEEPLDHGGGTDLVTGRHYKIGDLGIWLKPGGYLPGYLARSLWMVGRARGNDWFEVREIPFFGVPSPGLWAGQWYTNDGSKESALHHQDMVARGGLVRSDGFVKWPYWQPEWEPGDDVSDHLGVLGFDPRGVSAVIEVEAGVPRIRPASAAQIKLARSMWDVGRGFEPEER